MTTTNLDDLVGTAVLAIDTLWGGDVTCPSGTGRFVADCWFSDEPLPPAYAHAAAHALRASGGVSAARPELDAIDEYLSAVDVPGTLRELRREARDAPGRRGRYLEGLALCFGVMWELALERIGRGPEVPYERCVRASTGRDPAPSDPSPLRQRVAALLAGTGYLEEPGDVLDAVDAWRGDRLVRPDEIAPMGARAIAELDALTARHVAPHLPPALQRVPRANIRFLPIENAWFSGSMNYLGRGRKPGGEPEYEATYEVNASLQISVPEFWHLVSHEVVPGHVTTFAFLQNLYWRREVGFEASVLTMNTRAATLFEGIANNAILMAHGVSRVDDLPDPHLQLGVLLALLQDAAKNHASWLTWAERRPQAEVAAALRRDFLVSEERADKLSGAWGRHPLLGRMYLPAYQAGTEQVARLRAQHPPERLLPALYGCRGLVDVTTVEEALAWPGD